VFRKTKSRFFEDQAKTHKVFVALYVRVNAKPVNFAGTVNVAKRGKRMKKVGGPNVHH
jgi:hypothetical protein